MPLLRSQKQKAPEYKNTPGRDYIAVPPGFLKSSQTQSYEVSLKQDLQPDIAGHTSKLNRPNSLSVGSSRVIFVEADHKAYTTPCSL